MAMSYPADIWREILLAIHSPVDLLSLARCHPSFGEVLEDRSFLRHWLNGATPRVLYEFGDVGQRYLYGDWVLNFILPRYPCASRRYVIESLLAKGCNASIEKDGKQSRCGRRAGLSARDEATFSFDLLKQHGWKICQSCLKSCIVPLDDKISLAYLSTFLKIFPADQGDKHPVKLRSFRHLDKICHYYTKSDLDMFITERSSGLFKSFGSWRGGVIAKRGSTSELQIRALQHGARGFLELPAGPGRTQIALEIAYQSIKEYEHNMMKFVLADHPDLARLGLVSQLKRFSIE